MLRVQLQTGKRAATIQPRCQRKRSTRGGHYPTRLPTWTIQPATIQVGRYTIRGRTATIQSKPQTLRVGQRVAIEHWTLRSTDFRAKIQVQLAT